MRSRRKCKSLLLVLNCLLLAASGAAAEAESALEMPRLMPLAGEDSTVLIEPDDTLLDVAFAHRVGFESLTRLNANVDPWVPAPGTVVRLPSRYVLPDVEPDGLVINIPEMRMYDFTGEVEPQVLAAAVGDPDDPTPIGDFRIGTKRIDPAWHVPESIRREKPHLPPVVAPGPDNPLGDRWMTLGESSYGIHGTNVKWSIGRMATHGCVRLYGDQMRELFDRAPPGTRVQLVYLPFKWGSEDGFLYLEAHPDRYGRQPDRLATALRAPRSLGLLEGLDLEQVWRTVEEARGVPVAVGRLPATATSRPTY